MHSKTYPMHTLIHLFVLCVLVAATPFWSVAGSAISTVEADIILVVDNSGSMIKNDPKFITKEVVRNLVESLNEKSRIGMILFDEEAHFIESLTVSAIDENRVRFLNKLDAIDYLGKYTNIPAGIERAIYELKNNGRPDVFKGIIFLTDGIVDTGNATTDSEKKKWLKEELSGESALAGIRIFGVAFTENADIQLIQTLSLKTSGSYFRAYMAEDIPAVFDKIFEIIQKSMNTEGRTGKEEEKISERVPLAHVEPKKEISAKPEIYVPAAKTDSIEDKSSHPAESSSSGSLMSVFSLLMMALLVVIVIYLWFFHKTFLKKYTEEKPVMTYDQAHSQMNPLAFPEAKLIDIHQIFKREPVNLNLDKKRITIGRDLKNDIVLHKKTVSSFHATIEYRDGFYFLEDHRSTNGTVLNGRPISKNNPIQLKSGDRIAFADCEFSFIAVDQAPAGETILLESYTLSINDQKTLIEKTGSSKGKEEDLDDALLFKQCVYQHLKKVSVLGEAHRDFVKEYFTDEVIDSLADLVKDIIPHTHLGMSGHSTTLLRPPILFQTCILPCTIEEAKIWFIEKYDGFTNFLKHTISSIHFNESGCKTLCYITYGKKEDIWVSFTIIPVDKNAHAVEIMSVEFLTQEEKHALSLEFGTLGQILYEN